MSQRMNATVASTEKRAQYPAYDTNQDSAPKCAPETVNVKSMHEVIHEEEHETIHDEDENPEGKNDQRRRQEKQNGTQKGVQDSEEQRRAKERGNAVIANSTDNGSGNEYRHSCDRPSKNKVPHY